MNQNKKFNREKSLTVDIENKSITLDIENDSLAVDNVFSVDDVIKNIVG